MKNGFRSGTFRRVLKTLGLLWLAAVAGLVASTVFASPGGNGDPDLSQAIAAQERHTGGLLANQDVVGTAVGLTDAGEPAVLVFTKRAGAAGIPGSLDGVPVSVHVTGEIRALNHQPNHPAGSATLKPTSLWPRPVPIGVSTGNALECAAGTIGARVKAGTTVYALSNNHVYARQNAAALGEEVLQPGRYDTNCVDGPDNHLGNLSTFVAINFGGCEATSPTNTVDAAIAVSDTLTLGNSTPSNGYGTPKSATSSLSVNQQVQKYGRTTGQTTGRVVAINATVCVGYSVGPALFVNQIVILGGTKPYIRSGDSGSMTVTKSSVAADNKRPGGLNFAASASGYAFANPIAPVLNAFSVTVDGA